MSATPAASVVPVPPPLTVALDRAVRGVAANLDAFGDWYPDDTTVAGTYRPRTPRGGLGEGANSGWTTGFWAGQVWTAYELTGEDRFRSAGARLCADFAARMAAEEDLDTHDLGFLYSLGGTLAWRAVGAVQGRDSALAAARRLLGRVVEPAGIIQAWGPVGDASQGGRTIVDSLMNLPLLRWAATETGEDRFAVAARRHADQVRDRLVRADGSTFHTFHWDPVTGRPLHATTEQGHADDSCWARGQAWAVYGFALAARDTGEDSFRATAELCARRYLTALSVEPVPAWDLALGPGAPRDSSAAAVVACGLHELDRLAPGRGYAEWASAITHALAASYAVADPAPGRPLVEHGVYDLPKGIGVDEGTLWGDYFYLEALARHTHPDHVPVW